MIRIASTKPITSAFLRITIFLLVLGSLIAAISALSVFFSTRHIQELAQNRLMVNDHSLRVLWYDEVLTMSALMAATTEDPQWEVRYREHEPKLDESIRFLAAQGDHPKLLADQLNSVNQQLIEKEMQSFDLDRSGQTSQAFAILNSDQYRQLKGQYTELLKEYVVSFEKLHRMEWQNHLISVERLILFLFVLISVSALGWVMTLRASTKWNQKFRFLTERTLSIQEIERSRLAREIHDDLGQQLSALKIWLSQIEDSAPAHGPHPMKEALDILASCQESVRRLSQSLHPSLLQNLGLKSALEWLLRPISSGLDMEISISDSTQGRFENLPEGHRSQLYRIAQEAINNIQKHSRAQKIWIELDGNDKGLSFSICDNGIGLQAPPSGIGLFSMKERSQMLGGTIQIHSPVSHKTRLRLGLTDQEPGTEILVQFPSPEKSSNPSSTQGPLDGPAQ